MEHGRLAGPRFQCCHPAPVDIISKTVTFSVQQCKVNLKSVPQLRFSTSTEGLTLLRKHCLLQTHFIVNLRHTGSGKAAVPPVKAKDVHHHFTARGPRAAFHEGRARREYTRKKGSSPEESCSLQLIVCPSAASVEIPTCTNMESVSKCSV